MTEWSRSYGTVPGTETQDRPRNYIGITRRCNCGAIIEPNQTLCPICKWRKHLDDRTERTIQDLPAYERAAKKIAHPT